MTERYVEFHAASAFSFLEAASQPEQLIERAAAVRFAEAEESLPPLTIRERDDLSSLLRRLSEDTELVETTTRADAVKRPVLERHRHPRAGDALVISLKEKPALPATFGQADHPAAVMPKGRNFH